MPPKKQSVVDLPVVGVIDLNDEAPMKQKKTKKVKEVKSAVPEELELNRNYETDPEFQKNMELDFDKLLSLDFKPVKKSKPKVGKVKSPVPEELELNRNYGAVDCAQPVKATKKSNSWIDHIKKFSVDNGLTYNKSMLDPRLKESYVKSTGSKGKVNLG